MGCEGARLRATGLYAPSPPPRLLPRESHHLLIARMLPVADEGNRPWKPRGALDYLLPPVMKGIAFIGRGNALGMDEWLAHGMVIGNEKKCCKQAVAGLHPWREVGKAGAQPLGRQMGEYRLRQGKVELDVETRELEVAVAQKIGARDLFLQPQIFKF